MDNVPQPDGQSQAVNVQEREPSVNETASMIAQTLGEREQDALQQVQRIVWALGRTQSRQLLEQTLQIEQNGGMMLRDGSRRRTPGGVFFHLAYTTGQPKEGRMLQRPVYKKPKQEKQEAPQAKAQPAVKPQTIKVTQQPAPVLTWEDGLAAVKEAMQEKGIATTVKITLIGRPGYVLDKQQFVVVTMEHSKIPALPKGLPTPPSTPTPYGIYIATKQWSKVKEAISDPEDALIIEGIPKMDPALGAIAVFATNVTTKKLQMAKKQPQQAEQ